MVDGLPIGDDLGRVTTQFILVVTDETFKNTVICRWPGHLDPDPKSARCFEVTPDHRVVWKLKLPDSVWWITNIELLDPAAWVQGVVLR
jgi:hypothetical protein